jgi:hypothetical protein
MEAGAERADDADHAAACAGTATSSAPHNEASTTAVRITFLCIGPPHFNALVRLLARSLVFLPSQ